MMSDVTGVIIGVTTGVRTRAATDVITGVKGHPSARVTSQDGQYT